LSNCTKERDEAPTAYFLPSAFRSASLSSYRTSATMLYKTLLPALAAVAAGQQTCETLRNAFQSNE